MKSDSRKSQLLAIKLQQELNSVTAVYNAQKVQIEDQERVKLEMVNESRNQAYAHSLMEKQHTMVVEKARQQEAQIKQQLVLNNRLTINNKKLYEKLMATGSEIKMNTVDNVDMSSVDSYSARMNRRESGSHRGSMSPMKRAILQDDRDGPFLGSQNAKSRTTSIKHPDAQRKSQTARFAAVSHQSMNQSVNQSVGSATSAAQETNDAKIKVALNVL